MKAAIALELAERLVHSNAEHGGPIGYVRMAVMDGKTLGHRVSTCLMNNVRREFTYSRFALWRGAVDL